jgi:hypothetical protein
MTPADPVTLKGAKSDGSAVELTVQLEPDGDHITFGPSWYCAEGRRRFTLPAAKALLDRLDMTREFDAWYGGVDSRGQGFAAKVVDGRIYIDQEPRDNHGVDGDAYAGTPAAPNFSWSLFERAVKARTKRTKPQQA